MMQLRKIVNHPFLFLDYYPEGNPDWIWMTSGKFELLDRILPKFIDSGHKILIFSQFT
jgi:ATP-dependent helicase STH1/SNF2